VTEKHHVDEDEEAERRSAPGAPIIYDAIKMEGEEELERSSSALFWSGLSAGFAMGASLLVQGMLHKHLPDAVWKHLVVSLGYSIGFLVIVLGRQQLFTENTLTAILPLLTHKKMSVLLNVARLWAVVLTANLVGAWLFAWVLSGTRAFDDHTKDAFLKVSRQGVLLGDWITVFWRAIFAGWLIALMVWMLPAAETARLWVVIIISSLVGICGLAHLIAGAVEAFYLVQMDALSWADGIRGYLLPTLTGNILGGVSLVAMLNHAQVVSGEK